jgi:ATP-dependent RNA helicase SUPV3L1/SUV3
MIQKEKLNRFYVSQYQESAKKKKKNPEGKETYRKRIPLLLEELKVSRTGKLTQARLEDFHRRVRNIAYFAYRQEDRMSIMQLRDQVIPQLARLDLMFLREDERELLTAKFLDYLRTKMPLEICTRTLKSLCRQYSEVGIKGEIMDLVPARPELEFQMALQMERRFVLHIGPTNCGKTFHALERLREAKNGVYLGPLRLLALEVYERMKEQGIACTMVTGEECILEEDSTVVSSTIEMLELDRSYDVAVIDEAQMIADEDRGHSWTRAILGVQAQEIHICMSPAAEPVILHLLELCQDSYEIRRYERKTRLVCQQEPFCFPEDVQEGDALIVFTKRAVLDLAGRLEREGIRASVVYGNLPPEIRRRQIHLFTGKETKVVVSTDAIGMGLNLPVKRIVFIQTDKFDGKCRRPLTIPEIRQISGRAGRYGMYDTGYVNAMGEEGLAFIQSLFYEEEEPISRVRLGFPHVLLDLDEPLDVLLKIWKSVEPSSPFEKISIEEVLFLYERAYRNRKDIDGFEDKHTLYRMLTCSIDIKNKDIVDLWLYYCQTYTADVCLMFPSLGMCSDHGLMKYETYYKMLDLYHQFSTRLGKDLDGERLKRERERTEDTIMRLLTRDKKDYIQTCKYCGRALPLGYAFRVCDACFGRGDEGEAGRKEREERDGQRRQRGPRAQTRQGQQEAGEQKSREPGKSSRRRRRRRSRGSTRANQEAHTSVTESASENPSV